MNLLNPSRLDKKAVKNSFNKSAASYDRQAVLQHEIQNRLIERLEYINCDPEFVLDLGCGTGKALERLQKKYRGSRVIGLDLADSMLLQCKSQMGWFSKQPLVNADMERLPFAGQSIDLVFSSLSLQWSNQLDQVFAELKRIGKSGGLLMFATLGVDTLKELRSSNAEISPGPRVHQFPDMHDVGDMMMTAGLSQPVLDREEIVLEYREFKGLLDDLKLIGATNALQSRSRGLTTPSRLKNLEAAYRQVGFENGLFRSTWEVIYGHAWFA